MFIGRCKASSFILILSHYTAGKGTCRFTTLCTRLHRFWAIRSGKIPSTYQTISAPTFECSKTCMTD
ncbi:hypothetical protein GQ55_9G344300 [Panicum hallii var. hallii]|uniref:Secreted protein n=2 Tax=Panicum hallii TaxID=206008 RepID=A0A2T7C8F8_9POAL|nr:hypothetical protein PAHAL_9G309000 [Panicum hallii]PAN47945.1 hypothetical protein PAHAL_9G309000 [Panicum hallii]PUZ39631.1 hypothetical protein GQ55_9G344300 [Panicum hallii var. hallii]